MDFEDKLEFIDLGTGQGNSYKYIQKKFDVKNGLGIDIDKDKVALAVKSNLNVIYCNANIIKIFKDDTVNLVSMINFLQNLYNRDSIESILRESVRVAKDTVYIRGPLFYESYLGSLGFRFFWSNWQGHRYHIEPNEILEILKKYCEFTHELNPIAPVLSSSDPCIHPIVCAMNRKEYDEKKDPPKEMEVPFENVYKEFELEIKIISKHTNA